MKLSFLVNGVLLAALIGSLYMWRDSQQKLAAANEAERELKAAVQERDSKIAALEKKSSTEEATIQRLADSKLDQTHLMHSLENDLDAQRKRVEEKRKAYQDLLNHKNPTDTIETAARIKEIQDELQLQNQKLKSINQDFANTGLDAANAMSQRKSDAGFRLGQVDNRIQTIQAMMQKLRDEKASLPPARLDTTSAQKAREIDARIRELTQALNALRAERSQIAAEQASETQGLQGRINKTVADLKREQAETQKTIETKKAELANLETRRSVAGGFQKERDSLLKQLAQELQDETNKLKALEDKVRAQQAH